MAKQNHDSPRPPRILNTLYIRVFLSLGSVLFTGYSVGPHHGPRALPLVAGQQPLVFWANMDSKERRPQLAYPPS